MSETAQADVNDSEMENADSKQDGETSENKTSDASESVNATETGNTAEQAAPGSEAESKTQSGEAEASASLSAKLIETQNQVKDEKDRYIRLQAEFENFKKRIAKENSEKFKYYHMSLIKEFLPALDSLERAIEHAQKDNSTVEAMLEGIQMVYKLSQEALEKFGVSQVKAVGEVFDPTLHQAIGTVESESVPENHVVDAFQVGYLLHDRVVRPAMVRVSKKQ